jgi:uncharacterized protein YkwD
VAAALAAGCTVQPLTPTLTASATLPPVAVAIVTFTPAASETPVLIETATPAPIAASPRQSSPLYAAVAAAAPPEPELPAVVLAPAVVPATVQAPAEAPVPAQPRAEAPAAPPVPEEVAAAEQYALDLINARRAAAGVSPLLRDETLMAIARARVADMIARGYTGHNDPVTGAPLAQAWMRAAGYTSIYLGENWYGSIKPPPTIVDIAMAWFMTDPSHARNILNPSYVAAGVGIGYNGRQWLLIQNFAGRNE